MADTLVVDDGTQTLTNKTISGATMSGTIAYGDNAPNIGVKARAYLSANQLNLTNNTWLKVQLDTETYDVGSDFDISTLVSGTADGDTLNHLIDSGADFVTDGVTVGDRVKNTTDTTYGYVTAVAATDLTLNGDTFPDGNENYEIKNAKFVVPVTGYYLVSANAIFTSTVADKRYAIQVWVNRSAKAGALAHASVNQVASANFSDVIYLTASQYVELFAQSVAGVDTVDLEGLTYSTWMSIHLISV